MFVLANALTRGRAAELVATGGMMLGGLYMAWIGVTLMRSAIVVDEVGRSGARSNWGAFRRGVVTCLINPKAYLFMLAVYPQVLRPDFGLLAPQAAVMG